MKKQWIAALAVAVLAVQPVSALAAGSISNDSDAEVVYDYMEPTRHNNGGAGMTSNSSSANGEGLTGNTVNEKGQYIWFNEHGDMVVGGIAVHVIKEESNATAGLPANVVAGIHAINTGASLSTVTSDVDLSGYNALTQTKSVYMTVNSTGDRVETSAEVSISVPNLVEGLGTVQVLYYNNTTGKWQLLPVLKTDYTKKTVIVNLPCSGTYSVIYKR